MFYECKKCKRRWQYPLPECPYCLIPLDEMAGKSAKVSGVMKVSISTLLHPAAPYFVLLLEDEFGNLWAHKSDKKYQAGDELDFTPNTEAVAVWRVKYNRREAVSKAMELIGESEIDTNSKIVILPTIEKASHAYFRDNTSPEFLTAVLEVVLEKGVKTENVTVAGQSFGEISLGKFGMAAAGVSPVAAMAQKSGLIAACQKFGILPIDLAEGEFEKVGQFEVAKKILEADMIVNLAMEKIGRAAACENMFRVLRKENYLGQKYLGSEVEIAAALAPVMDKMTVVGEAEFVQRSNKLTTFAGLVLASKNAVNLDRVFNEITRSFKTPEIVKNVDLASIPIAGRSIKEVQYQAEIF